MARVIEESDDISLGLLYPILDCVKKDNKVGVSKFNLILFNRL